jgi:hypothetical protein
MFASQITKALLGDEHASKYFAGVFPSDQLPIQVPSYPCAIVANTDPADKKGEHWVAYHFDIEGHGEYFDSYGKPPSNWGLFGFLVNNGRPLTCNDVQLQGYDSDVCGQYCIAYLAKRARDESMYDIVRCYRGSRPGLNDSEMAHVVNKEFNIKPMQHGSGSSNKHDQCCCAKIQCSSYNCLKNVEKCVKDRC